MSLLSFLKIALKDYRTVGAMAPGSRYFARRVANTIKPDAKMVVEYGPGSGVITREILKILSPAGRLVVIEKNPDFVNFLKGVNDPRLEVIHDDVFLVLDNSESPKINDVDAVVSGIPFLVFAEKLQQEIIAKTHSILKTGGTFSFYQNLPIVNPELKKHFKRVSVQFEPRNFLPYFIITAEK